jgi:multiple sugar transport system permease protein
VVSRGTGRREWALLLTPAALLVSAVVLAPAARLAQLSLAHAGAAEGERFAGLEAYARSLGDGRWGADLVHTLVFAGVSVPLELALGAAFALVLDAGFAGRRWVRAIALLPWALPSAVMALAWGWIFNDSFGVANDLLARLGLVHGPLAWLGRPATAMAAMVVADVWKTTPFVALVVLAGLQGVPRSTLEAARLDGATEWQVLSRIVLPLAAPACLVALAFRLGQALGAFDLPYVLTGGGPGGATETASLYAYRCFYRYLDFGYGSALAIEGAVLGLGAFLAVLALARRAGSEA